MQRFFITTFSLPAFLLLLLGSCGFPNKALRSKASHINSDLYLLAPQIKALYTSNIVHIPAYEITNDHIKKYCSRNNITELSVQYDGSKGQAITGHLFDSTIVFHYNKSTQGNYVYEDIVYAFGRSKMIGVLHVPGTRISKLNDSLWIMRTDRKLITTF